MVAYLLDFVNYFCYDGLEFTTVLKNKDMETNNLFENFSEEFLADSNKFAEWVISLYRQGHLHGYVAVQPFAEELVVKFFHYFIPLNGNKKKEFIDKFTNYGKDGNRYSFDLEELLADVHTDCSSLRANLVNHIVSIRKHAEKYLMEKNVLPKEELSDLFYHLAHNMGGSDIYNRLLGITANVHYFNEHDVVSKEDLENYLNNYDGKEKEFGCNPLEKFKKDKASIS